VAERLHVAGRRGGDRLGDSLRGRGSGRRGSAPPSDEEDRRRHDGDDYDDDNDEPPAPPASSRLLEQGPLIEVIDGRTFFEGFGDDRTTMARTMLTVNIGDKPTHADDDRTADALFEEARRRRRRRWWTAAAGAVVLAVLVGVLTFVLGPGRPGGPPSASVRHHGKPGATAASQRTRSSGTANPVPYSAVVEIGSADGHVAWAADGLDLYVSTDAGHTWQSVTPPIFKGQSVFGRIGSMVAVGPDDLWLPVEDVIGLVPPGLSTDGSVRGEGVERSTDGGKTWAFSSLPGCLQDCGPISVSFPDAFHGFAAIGPLDNGTTALFSTTDGGATWLRVADVPTGSGAGIVFTSPLDGWAVNGAITDNGTGTSGSVVRTTDGGATWHTVLGLPGTDRYQPPVFFGSDSGVILGVPENSASPDRPVIFSTDDGGVTWTAHVTPADGADAFYSADDPGVPFAAVSPSQWVLFGSALFTTTDDGSTWNRTVTRPSWPGGAVSSVVFSSPLDGLAMVTPPGCPSPSLVGDQESSQCNYTVLMATTDGARTWVPSLTDLNPTQFVYPGVPWPPPKR
jgi:photosystem II stability/assembly factor-like uncharacterized protein